MVDMSASCSIYSLITYLKPKQCIIKVLHKKIHGL